MSKTRSLAPVLVIMQGPSGSGKSTLASVIGGALRCPVYSTDEFFTDRRTGHYNFDGSLLSTCHKWNQDRTREVLTRGESCVVDNTNIRAWEARPYVEMARELGVEVAFVRCTGRFPNDHGVPDEKVAQMWANLEELSVEKCLTASYPWDPAEPEVQL